jgi:hypothetical protein
MIRRQGSKRACENKSENIRVYLKGCTGFDLPAVRGQARRQVQVGGFASETDDVEEAAAPATEGSRRSIRERDHGRMSMQTSYEERCL